METNQSRRPRGKVIEFKAGLGKMAVLSLSFFLPVLIILIGMAKTNIYPFGGRSYLSIDGIHQYLPFFTELYDKMHSNESLFHSWNGGMGYDFFNVFSYYLLSPLTILIYFFPREMLNEAVTLLILLKTGLAGLSMATALGWEKKRRAAGQWQQSGASPFGQENQKGISMWNCLLTVSFGIMYALSNYCIGYHVNLMWMDAVLLLPWLSYGLKRLFITGKGCLYSLLLGLTIVCNYYIGIAVCLYLVFYFLCLLIGYGATKKRFVHFTVYSFLGGMLSFVVLLPAICQISNTKAADTLTVTDWGLINTLPSLLGQLLPGTAAVMTTADASLANIYCGSLAVLFLLLYFVLPTDRGRVKLLYGILLSILFLSFLWGGLNLLFHGMHVGFGFPNRHAFLFCYVMLFAGCQGAFYLIGRLKKARHPVIVYVLSVFILLAVTGELGIGAINSIKKNGNADRQHLMERYEYVMGQYGDVVEQSDQEKDFFRSDIERPVSRNEAMLYGQKCLSLFVSTVSSDYVETMHRLGFYTSLNRVQYSGYTDVTNMLFGVRYIEKLHRLSSKNPYSPIRDEDILLENQESLGIGYAVEEDILETHLTSDNPFENQNEFLKGMTGETLYQTEKLSATRKEAGSTSDSFQLQAIPGYHYYITIVDKTLLPDGQNTEEEVSVTEVVVDGSSYTSNCNRIYDIGSVQEEETVDITIVHGEADCYVGYYKEETKTSLYQQLSRQPFQVEEYHDCFIKGNINLEKSQVLFFSIAANEGWHVTVDGKEVTADKVNNAFLAIPLREGDHEVVLTYRTRGVLLGGACSLLAVVILFVLFFIQRKQ